MQKITPFLWFATEAEEAANYYTSIFKNSRITDIQRFGEGAPLPGGTVMTVSFELEGVPFVALNGGTPIAHTEATSFSVDCADQAEVDHLWDRLTENGGEPGPCGWLKDRYGMSWQIVPRRLGELLGDPDPGRAQRAMGAMLAMGKLDIAALEAAADG
jgi:predicted 3-demethylubiquinone-9 3-methyltransferase (glyoxalase superfamily)